MSLHASNASLQSIVDRDLREASKLSRKDTQAMMGQMATLTPTEARFLVDSYYMAQSDRIRYDNQVRAMVETGEPTLMLTHLALQSRKQEDIIKKALDAYTIDHPVGAWLRTIRGMGPVTSAGLLAYIDIEKAPTAGAIWKYAGIDGQAVWEKGQKRPWNAEFKTLCYKIGESFVKTSNKEDSVYGKMYKDRKALEIERNNDGGNAEAAARELATKNYSKGTVTRKALEAGKLSDAHLHARARRYAVKMFLSHLHEVMYITILGEKPPKPFAIGILGHAHYVKVPNPQHIREFVEPVEVEGKEERDE
jgi:hypothetical protein